MKSNNLKVVQAVLSGFSQRKVASMYSLSRNTVSLLVRFAKTKGWYNEKALEKLRERDFDEALGKKEGLGAKRDTSIELPDYSKVHEELAKENVTLKLLWEEYVERCVAEGKSYYGETQFRTYYHLFAKETKTTLRLQHKPGMSLQVDWAGTTIAYYDEEESCLAKGHLFVAVLPCSQLMYAEVFRDETTPNWLTAHVHCFEYLGGVPKTLVPDNLKTGVTHAEFYEPIITRSYQEMAAYYGTFVLPARVKKPRDKGAVENSVKICSQRILAKLRNQKFTSFYELQTSVKHALEVLNSKPLTGKNASRWQAFHAEEEAYLLALPKEPFELSEWAVAKVAPNCHVAYQSYFYSVPYEYVGESVEVRATRNTVEVFYHHERVASHKRAYGKARYVTVEDHMSPGKLFFALWRPERFLSWAKEVGSSCREVIRLVLENSVIVEHSYRSCFGILSLKKKYGSRRLEEACTFLLQQTKSPKYSQIKRILEKKADLRGASSKPEPEKKTRGFCRGAEYFKKGGKGYVEK